MNSMGWMMFAALALMVWAVGATKSDARRSEAKDNQEWTLAREGARSLDLRTRGGNIKVTGTEADQLEIHAAKRVRANSESEARAFLDQMKVERRRDGDGWVVEAVWPDPKKHGVESPSVSFEVRLPKDMHLQARTGGGNIEAAGAGETELNTGGGNVEAREIAGELKVHTGGGNIRLDTCAGIVAVDTGGGNIDIHRVQRTVKARTGGGNIRVEGRADAVEVNTGGGNIKINEATSPVKATTGGGNVEVALAEDVREASVELGTGAGEVALRLPKQVSARIEARTGLGHVRLEPATGARLNQNRSHLDAVLGDGQGQIRLRTGAGGIHIRLTGAD